MKLHLGCGKVNLPGFIHCDQIKYSHVDHVCDVEELPFDDNSADLIYACHVLEYFDWQEAEGYVLPEWHRVLKPNGVLRLAVPDFRAVMERYNRYGKIDEAIGLLYGRQFYNEKWQYHKCVYDADKLIELLTNTGFRFIRRWDWRKTDHMHIDDCSQAYLPHMDKSGQLMSLNLEGVK